MMLSIRLTEEDGRLLEELARKSTRSKSQQIRHLIRTAAQTLQESGQSARERCGSP